MMDEQTRERVRAELRDDPMEMTVQIAKRLGVPEADVIRELPDGRGVELDAARWQELFAAFEPLGDVHVIVSNSVTTCEVVGSFGGFSVWGEFFNVQSGSLDLHVRFKRLASAFAVEKPGHTGGGRTLSVQFFDPEGQAALKVFVNFTGKPTAERVSAFEAIRGAFRKAGGA
ncbi:MAG: ChuX/HutX family heme-like substrate-binding protein [Gemmataceae bacterium]